MIQRGLGRAAMTLGDWCDAYRPDGAGDPLDVRHRFMRLQASFSLPGTPFMSPAGYGQATWWGVFDAAYTRAGDYIVRPESRRGAADGGVWFVAAQQPLLPVLCVRASRVVTLARPQAPGAPGVNGYGGVSLATATKLLTEWPASMMSMRGDGLDRAGLPADAADGSWHVLLPAPYGVVLRSGDLMTDDIGRTGVVVAAELTDLGWRLLVKQAAT